MRTYSTILTEPYLSGGEKRDMVLTRAAGDHTDTFWAETHV